ncbi:sigma-54-dependent Fis family transcriptional regulator [Ramlibacter monticola]|uniref:Sigma-54-dependent Fis family transcriptional regulator n=1 Tax=Ramlibacter monticola TaxID=1926872 RepID=A0A937CRC7_9BURK|nr:sigma-54-dependent Fis family transcriptional regulator [Ramlibacter monticola]MBL0390136.1 sigma-54-dependent Fis family transcriptional regulator [Ramlibacter monticola]
MAADSQVSFSDPRHESAVVAAWESFLKGEVRSGEALRSLVDASWQRSLQAQVDPHARSGPNPLPDADLYLLRERQRELLEASAPVMACARDFLAETGTLMALADARSTILTTEGDVPALHSAETIQLVPGASWSEATCGTNAIGTALAVGQPVQIHSAEHFVQGIKRWTCSATVLRHPLDGELVGVLDVSGLSQTYSRQTLALVVTAASRIESRLAANEMERRYRLLEHAMGRFAGHDGVVLFDRRGNPIKANEHALLAVEAAGGRIDLAGGGRVPELAAGRLGRQPGRGTLPDWVRPEWLEPLIVQGEHLGTLLVVPPSAAPTRAPSLPSAPRAAAASAQRAPTANAFSRLVSSDPQLLDAIGKARQLARGRTPVLLLGETGVGKEEFARGIHGDSGGPYVALNCGGLSRELLASELFGYAEGAFTGARKGGLAGKIEASHGGTLFLDEIGEMPLDMQPNLLRVLEQGEIYRLGENTPRRVQFRLITATHRDLRKEIAAGRFRMDLFYRIAVTSLRIPPLRDRKGDIELLARHFLERFRREQGSPAGDIDAQALGLLQAYPWPGNVRELRNVIEGAVLLSDGPLLTRSALPREFIESAEAGDDNPPVPGGVRSIAEGEEALIRNAISASGGNLTLAARQLGIAKSTLYAKLQRYGLSR